MSKQQLQVKVLTPEATLHDGLATAVASVNDTGKFSILPQHTNFISIIYDKVTVYMADKTKQEWSIDKGIVSCSANKVEVYIEKLAEKGK